MRHRDLERRDNFQAPEIALQLNASRCRVQQCVIEVESFFRLPSVLRSIADDPEDQSGISYSESVCKAADSSSTRLHPFIGSHM